MVPRPDISTAFQPAPPPLSAELEQGTRSRTEEVSNRRRSNTDRSGSLASSERSHGNSVSSGSVYMPSIRGVRNDSGTPRWIGTPPPPKMDRRPNTVHPAYRNQTAATNSPSATNAVKVSGRDVDGIGIALTTDETAEHSPSRPSSPVLENHPPRQSRQSRLTRQLSMFRFGSSASSTAANASGSDTSSNHEASEVEATTAGTRQNSARNRLGSLRRSLSTLNLPSRLRQLAGTKRSGPEPESSATLDAESESTVDYPAAKSPRTAIHCQTCQCQARVRESLTTYQFSAALSPPVQPYPQPQPAIIPSHTDTSTLARDPQVDIAELEDTTSATINWPFRDTEDPSGPGAYQNATYENPRALSELLGTERLVQPPRQEMIAHLGRRAVGTRRRRRSSSRPQAIHWTDPSAEDLQNYLRYSRELQGDVDSAEQAHADASIGLAVGGEEDTQMVQDGPISPLGRFGIGGAF